MMVGFCEDLCLLFGVESYDFGNVDTYFHEVNPHKTCVSIPSQHQIVSMIRNLT